MPCPPAPRVPPIGSVEPLATCRAARGAARLAASLALLALVSGCGNRGDLYLASELDASVERDLEPLAPGAFVPDGPTDPSPLVPEGGVAPSAAPELDAPDGEPGDESGEEATGRKERRRDDGAEEAR